MSNTNPNEDDLVPESPIINGFLLTRRDRRPSAPITNGGFALIHHNDVIAPTPSSTPTSDQMSQALTLSEWTRVEGERWFRQDQAVNTSTQAVNGSGTYTNSSMSAIPGEEESLVLTMMYHPAASSSSPPAATATDLLYDLSSASWAENDYQVVASKDDDNNKEDDETPSLRLESTPRIETAVLIAAIGAHSDENIVSDMPRMIEGLLDQQRDEMYAERWRAAGVEGFQR